MFKRFKALRMQAVFGVLAASAAMLMAQPASAIPLSTTFTSGVVLTSGTLQLSNLACTGVICSGSNELVAVGNTFIIRAVAGSATALETAPGIGLGNGQYADSTVSFDLITTDGSYLSGANIAVDASGAFSSASDTMGVGGSVLQAVESSASRALVVGAKGFTKTNQTISNSIDIKAAGLSAGASVYSVSLTVPEPASIAIVASGIVGLIAMRRRRRVG